MKKFFLSAVIFGLFVCSFGQGIAQDDVVKDDEFVQKDNLYQPLTEDILNFGSEWFKREYKASIGKNVVISPLSFYQALALFGHGLNGDELKNLMTYSSSFTRMNDSHETLLTEDKVPFRIKMGSDLLSDDQVKITNSIWGNGFLPTYVQDTQKYLNADVKPLPKNTQVINDWINEKTQGKISNVLRPMLTKELDLFLVNTVYFKAPWFTPFEKNITKKMPFQTADGLVDVDMMTDFRKVDYFEDDKMQVIRLFYRRGDYQKSNHSMTFILPKEDLKLDDFVNQLSVQDFYLKFLKNVSVQIYLPKFKFSYQPDYLIGWLKKKGVGDIFKQGAFLGSKPAATLNEIIHKSLIEVDENGTEAAAVTVLGMDKAFFHHRLKRKEPHFIFKANRPFIFMIDEGLFVGVVNNPRVE